LLWSVRLGVRTPGFHPGNRLRNKYQHKTTRNAVRDLRSVEDKKEAEGKLGSVISMLDKLAKNNIIHKNKAANLKSKLTKHVAAL